MLFNTKSFFTVGLIMSAVVFSSCEKTDTTEEAPAPTPAPASLSLKESFENVGGLVAKGWSFKNNSSPIGSQGWRTGRYEPTITGYKLPVPYIGFPAHSAVNNPNEFVSCDATCVTIDGGTINSWLITPKLTVKNGDKLEFYTRAIDDTQYPVYLIDRLQVRANFTDGTDNVGRTATSVGSFTVVLEDINEDYINNFDGGFPFEEWTKYTITISGLSAPVANARFAFRYMGVDAGANGPVNAGVVGIDDFSFISVD